jgi:hypothetical protein
MMEAYKKDIRDIEAIQRARVDAVMARIRRVPPSGKSAKPLRLVREIEDGSSQRWYDTLFS